MTTTAPIAPPHQREAVLTERRNRADAQVADLQRRIAEVDGQHHGHLVAGDVEAADLLHLGLADLRAELAAAVELRGKLDSAIAVVSTERHRAEYVRDRTRSVAAHTASLAARQAHLEEIRRLADALRTGILELRQHHAAAGRHAADIERLDHGINTIDHGDVSAQESRSMFWWDQFPTWVAANVTPALVPFVEVVLDTLPR